MAFFFVEILKSTSTGLSTIANHAVSMLVFIVCLVEFLLMPNFQTSTFFILTVMSLLHVLAGVVVTIAPPAATSASATAKTDRDPAGLNT